MSRSVQRDCSLWVPMCPMVPSTLATARPISLLRDNQLVRGDECASLPQGRAYSLCLLAVQTLAISCVFCDQSTIDSYSCQGDWRVESGQSHLKSDRIEGSQSVREERKKKKMEGIT